MKQPSKNIAGILSELDPEKYKAIIERAANNGYHDFKFDLIPGHPEYAEDTICPKIKLVTDLGQFPELAGLTQRVIDGEFDDEDEDDTTLNIVRETLVQLHPFNPFATIKNKSISDVLSENGFDSDIIAERVVEIKEEAEKKGFENVGRGDMLEMILTKTNDPLLAAAMAFFFGEKFK